MCDGQMLFPTTPTLGPSPLVFVVRQGLRYAGRGNGTGLDWTKSESYRGDMSEEPVNIHAAKTHLSRLIERVEAGEEVVIARAGRPVARLVPFGSRTQPRRLGSLKGQIWLAPDWDSPEVNEAIARDFNE